MRTFLIILCSVITFCAQSQVVITEKVARYFLEQDDKVKLLVSKDSINRAIIKNQGLMLINKDKIIETYKNDSMLFETIIAIKDSTIADRDEQLKNSHKLLNKRTFQRDLAIGIGGGAAIGSLAGQPLIGAGAGAITVIVRQIFKKKARNL